MDDLVSAKYCPLRRLDLASSIAAYRLRNCILCEAVILVIRASICSMILKSRASSFEALALAMNGKNMTVVSNKFAQDLSLDRIIMRILAVL